MANVIITNEELELIVYHLEAYLGEVDSYSGYEPLKKELSELVRSLSVALDKNIEYID